MKEEKEKQNYETPAVEETTMVSKELIDSMQGALSKATETINKELKSAKKSVEYWEEKLFEFNNKLELNK